MANNMKSYIFTLLLLLLLVHNSLSAFPPSITKSFNRGLQKAGDISKQLLHGSPPPAASPVEIQGLSNVKQYFNDLGYIHYSDRFTDYLDNETISAIKTYQHFFNLKVNGELDNETLTQLSFPRCAVPDLNIVYELNSTNNVSWPNGKWFPDDTKVLTYGFLPESKIPPYVAEVFTDAFKRWSEAITEMNLTRLNFTETTYDDSDIHIGFYNFGSSGKLIELLRVGDSVVRFQNGSHGNKIVGDIRLDLTKYWELPSYNGTLSSKDRVLDLETVAMHEIGHLLGLSHSSNIESIMYPYILPTHQKKVQLSDDDKQNVKQFYSYSTDSTTSETSITQSQTHSGCGRHFTLFASSTLLILITTLSFGISLLV